mmetsp:Transcript_31832/g.69658  ORF Transcript_31832/g.69658 Transcript_31832/m.69658 type:complete len:80 (-) Transcript_31832:448-687(-)
MQSPSALTVQFPDWTTKVDDGNSSGNSGGGGGGDGNGGSCGGSGGNGGKGGDTGGEGGGIHSSHPLLSPDASDLQTICP